MVIDMVNSFGACGLQLILKDWVFTKKILSLGYDTAKWYLFFYIRKSWLVNKYDDWLRRYGGEALQYRSKIDPVIRSQVVAYIWIAK